jgi:hypothetical protein
LFFELWKLMLKLWRPKNQHGGCRTGY